MASGYLQPGLCKQPAGISLHSQPSPWPGSGFVEWPPWEKPLGPLSPEQALFPLFSLLLNKFCMPPGLAEQCVEQNWKANPISPSFSASWGVSFFLLHTPQLCVGAVHCAPQAARCPEPPLASLCAPGPWAAGLLRALVPPAALVVTLLAPKPRSEHLGGQWATTRAGAHEEMTRKLRAALK